MLSVLTIVFHGDRDATVHPTNGVRIFEEGGKTLRACSGTIAANGGLRSDSVVPVAVEFVAKDVDGVSSCENSLKAAGPTPSASRC
jgi:hypothetical protein